MKRIIYIMFFSFIVFTLQSQSYINYVIGRYNVLMSRSALQSNACVGILDLGPSPYSVCVRQGDSCFTNNSQNTQPWDILVQADSTFIGYEPWTVAVAASGKLFANDSINFNVYNFGSGSEVIHYWGFKLYSTVGITELNNPENELLISPQPASDFIFVQSTQLLFDEKKLPLLYDLNGKKTSASIRYVNANTYKIDARDLSSGIYFVVIETEKGFVRKKVIVGK